jgi:hypothetical protein
MTLTTCSQCTEVNYVSPLYTSFVNHCYLEKKINSRAMFSLTMNRKRDREILFASRLMLVFPTITVLVGWVICMLVCNAKAAILKFSIHKTEINLLIWDETFLPQFDPKIRLAYAYETPTNFLARLSKALNWNIPICRKFHSKGPRFETDQVQCRCFHFSP